MTDPRPEVVALATGLCRGGHPLDPRSTFPCEFHVRRAEETIGVLPAPFAIVDVDALTERVARWGHEMAVDGCGFDECESRDDWRAEARRLLEGGE